jgi:hypothetical protein
MESNHLGKLSVRLQTLPLQAVSAPIEAGTCAVLTRLIPELPEAFLLFRACPPIQTQVLTSQEQCVALALEI